jgi:Putative prokaryotic signal transducing protein
MTQRDRALRYQLGHSDSAFYKSNYPKVLSIVVVVEARARPRNHHCQIGIKALRSFGHTSDFGGSKIGCTARIRPLTNRVQNGEMMVERLDSTQARPDPNERLVKVFDSEDESEALVVKGLLESAGIESDLTSGSLVQDTFPGLGGMIILVREEDAEPARKVIAERTTLPDDDTAEIDIIEEPPQKS